MIPINLFPDDCQRMLHRMYRCSSRNSSSIIFLPSTHASRHPFLRHSRLSAPAFAGSLVFVQGELDLYEKKDTWSSLSLGIGNVIVGFVTKAAIFGLFLFLYQHRFFNLDQRVWWYWVLLFFADDFSYYWFHRTAHNVNWFWASHEVHHSSEHYKLAAALRQTWTGNATGAFLFWVWMPMVGFHPVWILFMQQLSLIYQFWIHTEVVNKLPKPLEFLLNTPSHHRVHHGTNLKYLDKNHGGILIIWDRLFCTFQPEEERPTYGLTKNIGSCNPFVVAF